MIEIDLSWFLKFRLDFIKIMQKKPTQIIEFLNYTYLSKNILSNYVNIKKWKFYVFYIIIFRL